MGISEKIKRLLKNVALPLATASALFLPNDVKAGDDSISFISYGPNVGFGELLLSHNSIGTENNDNLEDGFWSNAPPNPNDGWFKPYTFPYGQELASDVRNSISRTKFTGKVQAVGVFSSQ